MKEKIENVFQGVKAFVVDVEGVMVLGQNILSRSFSSDVLRYISSRDKIAIKQAAKQDFKIALISGSEVSCKSNYLNRLGVNRVYTNIKDPLKAVQNFQEKFNLKSSEILYLTGRTLPLFDGEFLKVCPADASQKSKDSVDYVTSSQSSMGSVAEIIEKVLRLRLKWFVGNQRGRLSFPSSGFNFF